MAWTAPQQRVVAMIEAAAAQTPHADASWLVADAQVESGLNINAVGDHGSSFGPFQDHKGGALGNHPASWAQGMGGILDAAKRFAGLGVRSGAGAAATQRPADPAGYAVKVNAAHASLPKPYKWSPTRPVIATLALSMGLTHTSGTRSASVGASVGAPNDWHSDSRPEVWADDYSGSAAAMSRFYTTVNAHFPGLQVLPAGHDQSTGPNVHVGGPSSWTGLTGTVTAAGAAAVAPTSAQAAIAAMTGGSSSGGSGTDTTATPAATPATTDAGLKSFATKEVLKPVGGIVLTVVFGAVGAALIVAGLLHATGNDQKVAQMGAGKLLAGGVLA